MRQKPKVTPVTCPVYLPPLLGFCPCIQRQFQLCRVPTAWPWAPDSLFESSPESEPSDNSSLTSLFTRLDLVSNTEKGFNELFKLFTKHWQLFKPLHFHSFGNQLLSTYYVPCTVPDAGTRAGNRSRSLLEESAVEWEMQIDKGSGRRAQHGL